MPTPRRHLLFLLPGPVAEQIDRFRRRFDPVMADRLPAHLTLVYPEEAADQELLRERIRAAAAEVGSFSPVVGGVNSNRATGGVWLSVEDPSGVWSGLREAVLAPPFRRLAVEPHVTVVHPRTSAGGEEATAALEGVSVGGRVDLHEVVHAHTTSHGLQILDRFPLGRRRRTR